MTEWLRRIMGCLVSAIVDVSVAERSAWYLYCHMLSIEMYFRVVCDGKPARESSCN